MIRINLLPVREARRRQGLQQQGLALVMVLVLSLLGTGYFHYTLSSQIGATREAVARIEAQIKKFEPQLKQVEAYKRKKAEVEQKLDVIAGLERSRSGPVHMLDALASHIPDRTWLTRMEVKGQRVGLWGKSLDNEIVAVFMTELGDSAYFGDVRLVSSQLETRSGLKLVAFEVGAMLADPHKEDEKPEDADGARTAAAPAARGGLLGR